MPIPSSSPATIQDFPSSLPFDVRFMGTTEPGYVDLEQQKRFAKLYVTLHNSKTVRLKGTGTDGPRQADEGPETTHNYEWEADFDFWCTYDIRARAARVEWDIDLDSMKRLTPLTPWQVEQNRKLRKLLDDAERGK